MTLFSPFARLHGAKSMIVYDLLSNYAQNLYLRLRRNAPELAKYGLYLALHKLQLKASNHIADPQTALGKTLTAAFDALVRELARRADAVTAPGIALAQYARRAGARRVHLVPNGIAEHFLKPHDGRKVRDELVVSDDELLVGYVGSVEFWLDLEPLLKALSRAKKRKPAKMLIVGKHLQTAYPQKVKETIRRYDLDKNVTWIDFIPHEEVPRYMAAVDLGTIPFNTANPTAWYAAPTKCGNTHRRATP
jgi:glycosyltransferase involved in cell wall biosynthesis